jgi:hypothetical protein
MRDTRGDAMKIKLRFLPLILPAAIGLALPGPGRAATTLLDWRDLDPGELMTAYLEVERPVTVRVTAVGTIGTKEKELVAYPWILDSQSRKVTWILDPETAQRDAQPKRKPGTVRVKQEASVRLTPGHYEVYFTTVGDARRIDISTWFGWNVGKKTSVRQIAAPERDDWRLTLAVEEADRSAIQVGDAARPRFEPLLRIAAPEPSTSERLPFRLDATATVVVYAIGELDAPNDAMSDGAWIERGADREMVWQMTPDDTRPAGGAEKNRLFRGTVPLAAGSYVLCYSSDDSHGPGDWNMNPPHDPEFWGAALFDYQGARAHFTAGGEDPSTANRIVDLSRQRDDAFNMRGIRIKRPLEVRVLAIGESGDDEHFADQGWIEEARSHKPVWNMTADNTEPAGGARKNRAARAVISLPSGDYLVCNMTDDSHAYGSWNATPPRDPESWGIQIWGAGDTLDRKLIEAYSADDDPLVLAQLLRIGNDSDAVEKFALKAKTRVRILAVGEGTHGQMFDYGWLTRVDGKAEDIVWKMRYAETAPAGGNDKNRREVKELDLAPGAYELHYVTDDSHSFEDWNSWPPDQPHLWGVSVTKIK